jgi:uncharacterized protein
VKVAYVIALVLVIIGGINWGLIGFLDFNLVSALFGAGSVISRVVYALVGLSALVVAVMKFMLSKDEQSAM